MGNSVSLKAEQHRMRGVADLVWITDKYTLKINFNRADLEEKSVRDCAIEIFLNAFNRTRWAPNIELINMKTENGVFSVEFRRGIATNSSDAVAAFRDFQGALIGGLYRTSKNFRDGTLAIELPSTRHSIFDSYKTDPAMAALPACSAINEEFANEITALKRNIENEFGPNNPISLNIR